MEQRLKMSANGCELAASGDVDALRLLPLEELTRLDAKGSAPIHWAAQCDRRDIIRYLLQKDGGGELLTAKDKKGRIPYDYAEMFGHSEMCAWLRDIGGAVPRVLIINLPDRHSCPLVH